MKQHKGKKHRIFTALLCFCILFTLPGISDVFPVVAAGQSVRRDNIIIDFYPLSEEVKAQTVSVGTDLDELNLPGELTVYFGWEQESVDQKAEENEQEDTEPENTEETANPIKETDIEDEEGQNTESEEGTLSDEITDVQEEVTGDTANTEDYEDIDEESVPVDEQEDEVKQEPHIVIMPEYQAENVISVETLENTQDIEPENAAETTVTISGVTWQSDPEYDGNTEGIYIFTAVLPDGYALAEGVSLPKIMVTVQERGIDAVVQTLLDRIAALPEVEEYLSEEPEVEDEEAYAKWEEELYEYAEEALSIWGNYEELTEEQQAQIPEEELAKLKAWVELAELPAETDRVMLADDSEHHAGWTPLSDSDIELDDGNYYLADDITMGTITITGDVTLCLNGHTLAHSGDTGSVIVVESGIFTLYDCSGNDSGSITDGKGHTTETLFYGGGVYINQGAMFHMYGGTIEGNTGPQGGGGVFINKDAAFHMHGGKIIGNTVPKGYGGGIRCEGNLNIEGGSIEGNEADRGGGIFLANGMTMTISNATITNNKVTTNFGGGVYSDGGASFYISDNVKVIGNQNAGNQANNFFIRSNLYICITGNLENSYIGVTVQKPPSESSPTPVKTAGGSNDYSISVADWSCFRSDNEQLEILKKETDTGNELWLVVPGSCDLGGLELSTEGATLSPAFDPDETKYTSMVANSVDKVGITATLADTATDASITMKINGGNQTPMTSGEKQEAALAEGENTIEITVTSGEMSKTYTLVITREEAKGSPVTITAYKDDEEWTDNPPDLKLFSDDDASFVTDLTAVPDGTYKIYDGDTDTRVTVTVAGAEAAARIDYYTVTFYDKDTALTDPVQQTVLKGNTASAPTDKPAKTGYTFSKWVTAHGGDTEYSFTAAVKGRTSVYASWTPVTYTITYKLDGGTATGNPGSYTIDDNAITLNNPNKAGHTFTGWSGMDLTGSTNMTVTIPSGSTGIREYTAHWKANQYTVALNGNGGSGSDLTGYTYGTGASLPTGWTKEGYTFAGWYDNEGCTGTAVISISNTDTGNKEFWAKWTDNIAPVIGTLQYSYQPKNFWHWLIGRDSLMITVPITEEGSGADEITYIVTPEGGTASAMTSAIVNGEAKITVSADFKGMIVISCTDKAGNTSASVTVGKDLDGSLNGIIIEDNPPQIAFVANGSGVLGTDEYETAPAITVTVTDNKDNAVSAGIASVSYSVGNGSTKTVDHDYTTGMVVNDSFIIPASEIPAGETVITVTVTDNAGNSITATQTIKMHSHIGRLVSAAAPTCTKAGNEAYYTCSCGKWFWDSGCTNEIIVHSEVTEAALGHDYSNSPYLFDGTQHWRRCSRCAVLEQKEAHDFDDTTDKCKVCGYSRVVEPGHTHSGILIAATEPTCTLPGNKAYYLCSCARLFSDSACTVETTEADIVLAVLGHMPGSFAHDRNEHWNKCTRCGEEQERGYHVYDDDNDRDCNVCGYVRTTTGHTHSAVQTVNEKAAACTEDGNKVYYICSCGKWFSNNACTNEITDHASVVLGKLGHDSSGKYQFNETGHWKVCSRCNTAQTKENHVYDDNNDTTCNKCDYKRKIDNPGTDNKDDQDAEPPAPQPTPEPTQNLPEPSQPLSQTNPPGTPQPTESPGSRPETTEGTPENGQPEDNSEPESTETPEPTGTEKEPETVPASTDNDRIVISGESIRTGNVNGMTDTSTTLSLGGGAIIVTVVCQDQTYIAGVADTVAVANAVLTQEQLALVNNGETIEIRIEVTDISDSVPKQDKEVIESGIEEYSKEVPGLTLGMYVDLSMFIRIGAGDWNAITATKEPIEVIIGVPDKLQEKSRTYYIIRAHGGEYSLMSDMDDEPDTITISTDMFSSYAIAYVQAEGKEAKCSLCHICPTFLGICYFIWLAIIILMIIIVIVILHKGKEQEQEREDIL